MVICVKQSPEGNVVEVVEEKKSDEIPVEIRTSRGFMWRMTLTIILGVAWLAFLIIWLFFFAGDYNVYQNIGIVILSVLILVGILGASWASMISVGMKYASEKDREMWNMKGFKSRIVFSIVVAFAAIITLVVWFFFFAGDYNVYQNIGMFIVIILVLFGILAAAWVSIGMKYASKEDREKWGMKGFKSRTVVSCIVGFAAMVFLLVWFFAFAADYNIYQNIAIIIVILLITGGIYGATWAPWGKKYGQKI